ncbi:MAG: hypothetical protein ACJARD_001317 [Alphaproteobacteria bacterium]|jgi:uncharacterized protein YqeY
MSIRNRLSDDMKTAMRAKDAEKLSVIRMALAKFKEADIECRVKGPDTAPEADLITVLTKMVKQRADSAKTYDDNDRPEAADKERFEITVLQNYLPQALNAEQVTDAIKQAIAQTQAASPNDTGKVVAHLKAEYAGQIDFGKIVPTIRQQLGA